jgi:hypothetical protein
MRIKQAILWAAGILVVAAVDDRAYSVMLLVVLATASVALTDRKS